MAIWIASGNRENWKVVKKHNIWGVPKRSRSLHTRVKVGDTILRYARSETHAKEVFPSVILGEFKVTELFEDTTPLFTAPPPDGGRTLLIPVQAETGEDIQNPRRTETSHLGTRFCYQQDDVVRPLPPGDAGDPGGGLPEDHRERVTIQGSHRSHRYGILISSNISWHNKKRSFVAICYTIEIPHDKPYHS